MMMMMMRRRRRRRRRRRTTTTTMTTMTIYTFLTYLFMPSAQGVDDLVDGGADVLTTTPQTQQLSPS
jgi:hypothetical protein